jgi:hypothetical protein
MSSFVTTQRQYLGDHRLGEVIDEGAVVARDIFPLHLSLSLSLSLYTHTYIYSLTHTSFSHSLSRSLFLYNIYSLCIYTLSLSLPFFIYLYICTSMHFCSIPVPFLYSTFLPYGWTLCVYLPFVTLEWQMEDPHQLPQSASESIELTHQCASVVALLLSTAPFSLA